MPQQRLCKFSCMRLIWMSLACLMICTPLWATAESTGPAATTGPVITIDNDRFSQRVAHGLMFYKDAAGDMDLASAMSASEQGRFHPFEGPNLQLGYSDDIYWIRLNLSNELLIHTAQNKEDRFYISVDYPLLDNVEFFHVREDGIHSMVSGDLYQFNQRYFRLNNYVFPIALQSGEHSQLYIRVFSQSSLSIPIHIETERAFIDRQFKMDSLNGIYLGITVGLCIYNLFLWIGVRKSIYGLYVLVIVNLLLFNTSILGFSFRLWPAAIAFQQIAIYLFSFTSGVAILLFGMAFLKTKTHQPIAHRLLQLSLLACALCIPALSIISIQSAATLTAVTTLSVSVILIVVALRSIKQGYPSAKYYAIGQGAVIISVMFTALTSQKIIPFYHLAPHVMKWCSAFELIFFSFGLADLVNQDRRLREHAQKESARAQQELLSTQISLNKDLDELVRERTEELETLNRRLLDLNTTDDLTGLRNRRYFNEVFAREYKRAYREKTAISVMMIDIDCFKQLNDTHGHQFGDIVLSRFGKTLQHSINRPPDIAIRYGGEEFVVLLPCTGHKGAINVAEGIRKLISDEIIRQGDFEASVTVSIGVASTVPTRRDQQDQLLREADDMLYLAKEKGRNRVEWDRNYQEPSSGFRPNINGQGV